MTDRHREVSKDEFQAFLAAYPRPLEKNVHGVYDPPLVSYNDWALADKWPDSMVAYYCAARGPDDPAHGYEVLVEIPTVTAPAPTAAPANRQDDGYLTWDEATAVTTYYYSAHLGPDSPESDCRALNDFLKA